MSKPQSRLSAALLACFEPIASVLLRQGVDAKSMIDLIKEAFVRVAIKEHGKRGRPASTTRVSELTGLNRKEVARLRAKGTVESDSSQLLGRTESTLLHYWFTDPRYLDKSGLPRALEYGPGEATFCDLAKDSLGDASPAIVLDSLLRNGSVVRSSENHLSLARRENFTTTDLAMLLAEGLGTLANTIKKNFGCLPDTGLMQRSVFSTRLDPDKTEIVRRALEKRVADFAVEIDDYLAGYETEPGEPFCDRKGNELIRLGVGAYYFEIEK